MRIPLDLFPDDVVVRASPPRDEASPYAVESDLMRRAVTARRMEFLTARGLAREALAQLGFVPCAIPVGSQREPIWPAGIVGSISHSRNLCVAALARAQDYRSLGIDVAERTPLSAGMLELICTPIEQSFCAARTLDPLLIFSAKEAIFKAMFPVLRSYIDFLEVEVTIGSDVTNFTARGLSERLSTTVFPRGSVRQTDELIFTSTVWTV